MDNTNENLKKVSRSLYEIHRQWKGKHYPQSALFELSMIRERVKNLDAHSPSRIGKISAVMVRNAYAVAKKVSRKQKKFPDDPQLRGIAKRDALMRLTIKRLAVWMKESRKQKAVVKSAKARGIPRTKGGTLAQYRKQFLHEGKALLSKSGKVESLLEKGEMRKYFAPYLRTAKGFQSLPFERGVSGRNPRFRRHSERKLKTLHKQVNAVVGNLRLLMAVPAPADRANVVLAHRYLRNAADAYLGAAQLMGGIEEIIRKSE